MTKPILEMSSFGPSALPDYVLPSREQLGDVPAAGPELTFALQPSPESLEADETIWLHSAELPEEFAEYLRATGGAAITLHDAGAHAVPRLLAGLAAALGRPVHRMLVRRSDNGRVLATLSRVDVGTDAKAPVYLYGTPPELAMGGEPAQLGAALIAHSRLCAMMVGAIDSAVLNWHLQLVANTRDARIDPALPLLLLPLVNPGVTAAQAMVWQGSTLSIRTAPLITRPADAWQFVCGIWSMLRDQSSSGGSKLPSVSTGAAQRRELISHNDVPHTEGGVAASSGASPQIQRYVTLCGAIKGVASCCVFDLATERPLAYVGNKPGPAALAAQGAAMFKALRTAASVMGLAGSDTVLPDAALSLAGYHVMLHPVPHHPDLVMHAVLDRAAGNLALARAQFQRLDAQLQPDHLSSLRSPVPSADHKAGVRSKASHATVS